MSCGCSGSKRVYEYVAPDGKVTEVSTQAEAIALVRKNNAGKWRIKRS